MPITRITSGDGRTTSLSVPERKNVVRPDVAYVMDDIMKDVINRGTAAHAQEWGFRNEPGKRAFAGKTGTSRDGWFAGFTPELVCVVYVGFDNGDDLGMKGSDSAMPVWADFMKEALAMHPEWNGDWTMPTNLRKAEIDIRNGALIREIDPATEASASPTPTASPKKPKGENAQSQYYDEPTPDPTDIYVTNVPTEFRRIELFVEGTVPTKVLLPTDEQAIEDPTDKPAPTPTPLDSTWQEETKPGEPTLPANTKTDKNLEARTTVMICPLSGMRATVNCPIKEAKVFTQGQEPKDFGKV